MKRCFEVRSRFLILLGLAILASSTLSRVQAQLLQGSITGNVTDSSEAAVAEAKVVVTNQQTNFSRDAVTNSVGGYNIPTLPPGTYAITVTAPGFQTFTVTGVIVSPEEVTRRISEFRNLGWKRGIPAQVVYQDPNIICPWPNCGLRINAIQFHLEKWPDLEKTLLEAWWQGPGLAGRCPKCDRCVLFGLTTKATVSEPATIGPAILPDDWKDIAYIVTKPETQGSNHN
jgi:hypothetical protein